MCIRDSPCSGLGLALEACLAWHCLALQRAPPLAYRSLLPYYSLLRLLLLRLLLLPLESAERFLGLSALVVNPPALVIVLMQLRCVYIVEHHLCS